MKYIIYIYSLLILFSNFGCESNKKSKTVDGNIDDYYEKCRKLVISENKIGQVFEFKINSNEIDEFTFTYLGIIKTRKGDTLKFLNAINFYGSFEDAKHANGFVFIYDGQNKRIGNYYVGGSSGIPILIEGNNLIFSNIDKSCNQTTKINFFDSIPRQIYIECTKTGGDVYSFAKD